MRNAGELPWLLVGGGLANCLLALRLERLGLDYRLLERGSQICGDHTWSSFVSDYSPRDQEFISELASFSWDRYQVRFPQYTREIKGGYLTLRSEDLRRKIESIIPARKILRHTDVHTVAENAAESDRGIFLAKHIVRADGFPNLSQSCGYQKFVGWDLLFAEPHGLESPVIMDARVAQTDGYRFFYLLPFDKKRILVEETRYSNFPHIDGVQFAAGIRAYVAENFPGLAFTIERREQATLPIPLNASDEGDGFGVAGGFFHPTTGYSLPYAVRASSELIEFVRAGFSVGDALNKIREAQASTQSYYYLLNRMMFLAARPEERFRIFERFYRLDANLIGRFYAGTSTWYDKARLLLGRPPVKVLPALKVLPSTRELPAWN